MTSNSVSSDSTPVVIVLLVVWLILAVALVYFYRKLNKDTNGQYEIHRLVFAEGGLRDQLRQGVGVVENRFNVRIWPQPRDEEQEDLQGDEGGDEEEVGNDKQNESHAEEGEEQDGVKDDSSDDYSSIDLRERANLKQEDKNTEKSEDTSKEDKKKQKEDAAGQDETHSEELKNEEKVELLVDFKPFAGSAIWSEECKDEGNDMTAL